jgi:hypothetical protein
MPDQIERALHRLEAQLHCPVSLRGEDGYAAATAIWAKPVGRMPRAVVHCLATEDIQLAIRAARDCGLPLSVRGGGHHWAARALCAGIVIDLSGMNGVSVAADQRSAIISGGARAADVAAVTDPLHVAAVTGTCSAVACTGGPDGKPVIIVHPTWCGPAAKGEAPVAPFLKLGTLLAGNLALSYGTSLTLYDPYIVNGQRVFMDTCWLPALDSAAIDVFVEAMDTAASTQCALFTHEFKGAASRVPVEATAFGLRRDHCWSRSSPPSSIGRTRKRSNGIANGLEPLVKPSIRSRFRVDIRTFSSRTMRTVWRRAMAPMPAG